MKGSVAVSTTSLTGQGPPWQSTGWSSHLKGKTQFLQQLHPSSNMAAEFQGRHSSLGQWSFACFLLTDETIHIFSFFQSKCRFNFIMHYRCFERANSFQKNLLSNIISLCLLLCRKSHDNFLCLTLHTYSFFCLECLSSFQLGESPILKK